MKTIKRSFLFCMLTCLMILVIPTTARAATASLTTLKNNKTYSSYDVTRNGKKDKIKIVQTKSYATSGTTARKVYVNGKYRFTAEGCKGCAIYVFRSGTKSVILSEFIYGDGGSDFYAYQYSGGKFKKKTLGPNTLFYTEAKRSGSYLKLVSVPKHTGWMLSFSNYAPVPFEVVDTYKSVKRSSGQDQHLCVCHRQDILLCEVDVHYRKNTGFRRTEKRTDCQGRQ